MRDVTTCGIIAGLIGAMANAVIGLFFKSIGITDRTFHDFGQVLIMFKTSATFAAFWVGTIAHLVIGITGGVLFAHFLKGTSPKNIIMKGLLFGALLWVTFMGLGTLFRLPLFSKTPPIPALLILGNSIIYGFVMSYVLRKYFSETFIA